MHGAHYRGQVKRRMQRFVSDLPCTLVAGQMGMLQDGRGFKVVEAVAAADGRSEFLAVTNPAPESAAQFEAEGHTEAQMPLIIAARQLTLPYELPPPRA